MAPAEWAMAITPSGLNQNAPKVGVAGFGDPAAPDPLAAGILTRDHPSVAHQKLGTGEACK